MKCRACKNTGVCNVRLKGPDCQGLDLQNQEEKLTSLDYFFNKVSDKFLFENLDYDFLSHTYEKANIIYKKELDGLKYHVENTTMNKKTVDLETMLKGSRQMGSTTYLLNAAIKNPNVTIVVANSNQAKMLEQQYEKMLEDLSWWKKILRKIETKNRYPYFISLRNYSGQGHSKRPVVIDLYAIESAI